MRPGQRPSDESRWPEPGRQASTPAHSSARSVVENLSQPGAELSRAPQPSPAPAEPPTIISIILPARPAAHCKAVQKFAQLPHIPWRPVNPHTAAPQTCNLDSQGRGLLHTDTRHTSLEPVNCQLTVNNVCCLCPVFPCRVLMSHQLNMEIVCS